MIANSNFINKQTEILRRKNLLPEVDAQRFTDKLTKYHQVDEENISSALNSLQQACSDITFNLDCRLEIRAAQAFYTMRDEIIKTRPQYDVEWDELSEADHDFFRSIVFEVQTIERLLDCSFEEALNILIDGHLV